MDKKIIFTVVLISLVIVILGTVIVGSTEKKKISEDNIKLPNKESLVYYYGITCPHCAQVSQWMERNNFEKKVKIEKKEVYQNQNNNLELEKVAKNCGLNPMMIGVPFLYAKGQCYIGYDNVIRVLESELKKVSN